MVELATNARRTHDELADSYAIGPRDTCTYVPFGPRNKFADQAQVVYDGLMSWKHTQRSNHLVLVRPPIWSSCRSVMVGDMRS